MAVRHVYQAGAGRQRHRSSRPSPGTDAAAANDREPHDLSSPAAAALNARCGDRTPCGGRFVLWRSGASGVHVSLFAYVMMTLVMMLATKCDAQQNARSDAQRAASEDSTVFTSRRSFLIPFKMSSKTGNSTAVLFSTRDRGLNWRRAMEIPGTVDVFPFEAKQDGIFGFAVAVLHGQEHERLEWPRNPELFVCVDTEAPVVKASLLETLSGKRRIDWQAEDPYLDPSTLLIQYTFTEQDKWISSESAETIPQNSVSGRTGVTTAEFPASAKRVRISIADRAGNVGSEILTFPRNRTIHQGNSRRSGTDRAAIQTAFDQIEADPRTEADIQPQRSPDHSRQKAPSGAGTVPLNVPPVPLSIPPPVSETLPYVAPRRSSFGDPLWGGNGKPLSRPATELDPLPVAPVGVEILLRAARTSAALEDYPAALDRYGRILSQNPDNQSVRREYAGLLLRLRDPRAIPQYEYLLKINPNQIDILREFADALLMHDQHARAIEILNSLANGMPVDLKTLESLLFARVRLGDVHAARRKLDQVFPSLDPTDVQFDYRIGHIELSLGRPLRALPFAAAAFRTRPENQKAGILLIQTLARLERHAEAVETAQNCSIGLEAEIYQWLELATDISQHGSFEASEYIYSELRASFSDHAAVVAGQSRNLLRQGHIQQARMALVAPSLSREDPDLLVARAMVQLEAGEYSEALAHTYANSPEMRMIRGDVYARVGAFALAEQEYLQSEKAQNEIDLSLSRIYASVGRFTPAATMAEQILHQEPFNKAAWSQFVEVKIKAKHHDEAIVLLKAGILENETAEVFAQFLHALLGRVYLSQGQSAAALQEFQLARLDEGNNITEPDIAYDYYRALLSIRPFQAADHLAMALKTPHIVNSIARIAIGHHDIALAKQIIFDTARQYPNNLILTLTLGDIFAVQDSPYADAVAAYSQALKMSPTNIKAQVGLATYHWNVKSFEDSDRHFHHVLRNLPDHRRAARNHARMLNQWKGKRASLFAYEQLLSGMSRPLAHQLFLEDPQLLKSKKAPSSLSDLETLSATLERNAIQLSDWRPVNASYTLERLKNLEPADDYVSFLLANQYQRIGETRNAIAAYENLLSREPANIDAFTALKHARLALRPRIDGKAVYVAQEGREGLSDITSFTFGAQTVLPIADEVEFVGFGYHHQIFMPPGSERTAGDALLLSGRSEVADRLFLFADMEVTQYSTGFSTRPTFEAGVDYVYLDGLNLGFDLFLHNVAENTETIRQDIYRYGLQAHSKWVPSPKWRLNGLYRFQQYSDTNLSHSIEILNLIELMEAPRQLQLTAAFNFDTYSEETIRDPLLTTLQGTVHPYFSPRTFGYVNVGAVWRHWLKRMQYGNEQLYYELRYALQWDSENVFYNNFGGGIHWDICHNATVGVETNFLRSGAYDSATVVTHLTLWFP